MNRDQLLFLLFVGLGCVGFSLIWWTFKNGISPMPTSSKVKKCLFSVLPESLGGKIYELGSGWGTLLFPLAKRYPKSAVVGFETSPFPFWLSFIRLKFSNSRNIELKKQDFFTADLRDAALIVCYLYPGAMSQLRKKFEQELQQGVFVVTHTFAVPGWVPEKVVDTADLYHSKIYIYKK
jgi:predicted RNA methylase